MSLPMMSLSLTKPTCKCFYRLRIFVASHISILSRVIPTHRHEYQERLDPTRDKYPRCLYRREVNDKLDIADRPPNDLALPVEATLRALLKSRIAEDRAGDVL